MILRPITSEDASWVAQVLQTLWDSTQIVARGKLIKVADLDGFLAEEEGRKVGLITYIINAEECEIMSLNVLTPGKGIGSALLEKVEEFVKENGCGKIITQSTIMTNDFFQKHGFEENGKKLLEYRL